jgi:hypothetical protein
MTALGRPRMAIKIYKPDRCDAAAVSHSVEKLE